MATEIKYGASIITLEDSDTIKLETKNKIVQDYIVITEQKDPIKSYFKGETTLLSLNLDKIADFAFQNQANLTELKIYDTTEIGQQAFSGCSGLTSVVFDSFVPKIALDAFDKCPNLTTIFVSWAEGEVANVPWGATNAEIIYMYGKG